MGALGGSITSSTTTSGSIPASEQLILNAEIDIIERAQPKNSEYFFISVYLFLYQTMSKSNLIKQVNVHSHRKRRILKVFGWIKAGKYMFNCAGVDSSFYFYLYLV
jgi:hypothetical protein